MRLRAARRPTIETCCRRSRRGADQALRSARGIDDVTFSVMTGEVFGFLGPNGAGKTTTIRTLLGLLRPTAGTARILGHDVWRDGVAARARTGFLPGEFAFDEQVTGEELLDLFADLRGIGDRAFARSLAGRFEADLRRPLGELSRGNRQKIGLIQALVHRPPVVVMDEPTAGLDPLMQEEFARLVGELRADGTTVFLSSHNLAEVERMCDRVGILRDGRLAAVESVEAITGRALRHVTASLRRPCARRRVPAACRREQPDGRRARAPLPAGRRAGGGRAHGRPPPPDRHRDRASVARGDVRRRLRPSGGGAGRMTTVNASQAPDAHPLAAVRRLRRPPQALRAARVGAAARPHGGHGGGGLPEHPGLIPARRADQGLSGRAQGGLRHLGRELQQHLGLPRRRAVQHDRAVHRGRLHDPRDRDGHLRRRAPRRPRRDAQRARPPPPPAAGQLAGGAAILLAIALVLGRSPRPRLTCSASIWPIGDTLAGILNLWPLGLFFGGVTLLLAGLTRRPAVVGGGAAGVLAVMYLMEVLGKLSDAFGAVDGLSAFHYYGSAIEDGLDLGSFAILVVAGALLAAAGCVLFERRDVG